MTDHRHDHADDNFHDQPEFEQQQIARDVQERYERLRERWDALPSIMCHVGRPGSGTSDGMADVSQNFVNMGFGFINLNKALRIASEATFDTHSTYSQNVQQLLPALLQGARDGAFMESIDADLYFEDAAIFVRKIRTALGNYKKLVCTAHSSDFINQLLASEVRLCWMSGSPDFKDAPDAVRAMCRCVLTQHEDFAKWTLDGLSNSEMIASITNEWYNDRGIQIAKANHARQADNPPIF